jgi:hypothetical protein
VTEEAAKPESSDKVRDIMQSIRFFFSIQYV